MPHMHQTTKAIHWSRISGRIYESAKKDTCSDIHEQKPQTLCSCVYWLETTDMKSYMFISSRLKYAQEWEQTISWHTKTSHISCSIVDFAWVREYRSFLFLFFWWCLVSAPTKTYEFSLFLQQSTEGMDIRITLNLNETIMENCWHQLHWFKSNKMFRIFPKTSKNIAESFKGRYCQCNYHTNHVVSKWKGESNNE